MLKNILAYLQKCKITSEEKIIDKEGNVYKEEGLLKEWFYNKSSKDSQKVHASVGISKFCCAKCAALVYDLSKANRIDLINIANYNRPKYY